MQRRYGIVGRERELRDGARRARGGRHLLLEGPSAREDDRRPRRLRSAWARDGPRGRRRPLHGEPARGLVSTPRSCCGSATATRPSSPGRWSAPCAGPRPLPQRAEPPAGRPAQNLLLPALDEGVLQVPHLGQVRAAGGFQVVATQNPAEYVATGHLSEAVRDRLSTSRSATRQPRRRRPSSRRRRCGRRTGARGRRLVRATRLHPRVRRGRRCAARSRSWELARRWTTPGPARPQALRRAAATRCDPCGAARGRRRAGRVARRDLLLVVETRGRTQAALVAGVPGGGSSRPAAAGRELPVTRPTTAAAAAAAGAGRRAGGLHAGGPPRAGGATARRARGPRRVAARRRAQRGRTGPRRRPRLSLRAAARGRRRAAARRPPRRAAQSGHPDCA